MKHSPDEHDGSPAAPESETPRWVCVHTVDEMEAFYKAILPQIRTEARYHGYAVGLHGSMRRDLDLIAIPWSDDHSDRDELARAIQEAACGMPQVVYQWNTKPCGRMSVSIPVCWPEWPEEIGDGHIDLSVMPDLATALSLAQTEIKGHMRVEDELRADLALAQRALSNAIRISTEAQARIAELEKDAARYRWLRDCTNLNRPIAIFFDSTKYGSEVNTPEATDAAIDAALKDRA